MIEDERLGAVDAAWLQMDGPENTADVVALLTFRALPPPATLRALLAERRVLQVDDLGNGSTTQPRSGSPRVQPAMTPVRPSSG